MVRGFRYGDLVRGLPREPLEVASPYQATKHMVLALIDIKGSTA